MSRFKTDKLTAAMLHMQAAERHKAVGINHNPFDVFDCEVGEAVLNVEHEKIKAFDFAEREKVRMSQLQGVERVRNKFAQAGAVPATQQPAGPKIGSIPAQVNTTNTHGPTGPQGGW